MTSKNCNHICWNVRGFNDGAKRASVRSQIISTGATIICLQETKISAWIHNLLVETVGLDMVNNAVYLPSVGASGGILLLAASERFFNIGQPNLTMNTVSATISMLAENKEWTITGVYGPQADADKIIFMQEITDLKQHARIPALLRCSVLSVWLWSCFMWFRWWCSASTLPFFPSC